MEDFPSVTRLVELVLVITLIEGVALAAYHRVTGRGLAPRDYALNMLSGLFLMLALRFALASAGWMWIVPCLVLAGLAHGADIWGRWPRRSRTT